MLGYEYINDCMNVVITLSRRVTQYYVVEGLDVLNISLRYSSNSEANASELLENLEEIFPRYS